MLPGRETTASRESQNPNPSESSFARTPAVALPKGGGAIRGIGEKFAANPVTGSGTMSIPIAASPGRAGFGPALSLSYDSGSGNGPFGFGWSLALPAITRKTDKGIPRYGDGAEPDVFVLSGAEDLVPTLVADDGELHPQRETRAAFGAIYEVQRYRPRIEGLFARIEHWSNTSDPSDTFWRSISRDNLTTWYGRTHESRVADPADPRRTFSWLICETHDDKGNVVSYAYKPEDSQGIDLMHLHERNRSNASRSANRYIKRVRYGNRVPYLPDLAESPRTALPTDWCFELVFDYGEHDPDNPHPLEESSEWNRRNDPFSTYRAGFEVRTYRLCQRVLMFHHFSSEPEVGGNCLVRSTDFEYSFEADPADARNPIYSFLLGATHAGYRRGDGGSYRRSAMPAVEFEYSQPIVDDQIRNVDPESLRNLPYGVDDSGYRWIDLDGEGMPGILTDQAERWYYKRNESPATGTDDGIGSATRFGPLQVLSVQPAEASLSGAQQLLDLAGDGQLDLVKLGGASPGFYERTQQGSWTEHIPFKSLPGIEWADPNVRFVDLTGDGHADVLITENDAFCWHASLTEAGFGPAQRAQKVLDEETGPRIVFADATQSIFLADLSGDGLTDIVRVRNGEVCYWPNLGYCRFGAKVGMDRAPWFEAPDVFDPRRIRLADIDGSGTSDILYLASTGVRVYFNQSGNGWSPARPLAQFPATDSLASAAVVDLLGNGTACLVWSSPLAGDSRRPMRYIDLMGGQKPHLLVTARNNLGAETHVHYAPSTRFYVEDRDAGTPWITHLPFPVHVVERVETLDRISRNRFVTRYRYGHGYFDGLEREFRGFGRVDQWDTEEIGALRLDDTEATNLDAGSYVPPVHTRTWFHTGAYLDGLAISRQFEAEYYTEPGLDDDQVRAQLLADTIMPAGLTLQEAREACRALKGSMLRQEVYAEDGAAQAENPYTVSEQNFAFVHVQAQGGNRHAVFFVHPRESISFHYERNPVDPRIAHQLTLVVDAFGNVLRSASIGYGRRQVDGSLLPQDQTRQTQLLATYTENEFTEAIDLPDSYRVPVPSQSRSYEVTGLALSGQQTRLAFDAVDEATAQAQDIAYEATPDGSLQRRLIEQVRTLYRRNDLSGALPLGQIESLALPFESHRLAFTPGLLAQVFGERVADAMLTEGAYVHSESDVNWWVPSGRSFLSPNAGDTPGEELAFARQHFFAPQRLRDPFGNVATVGYDAQDLLAIATRDPLDNLVQVVNDYRVLQPRLVTDPNGNRSEAAFDTLGMVVGTAVMGKANQTLGDSLLGFAADLDADTVRAHLQTPLADPHSLLQGATTRLVYDLFAYQRTQDDEQPQAAVVYTLARETHLSDLADDEMTRVQHAFAYSDGFGREIQKKVQAEPGPIEVDGPAMNPRWVGSGWTIFNNKGKPVRQFEPFFSATHAFEFDRQQGVSPVLFYDPLERVVATLHPNQTWEKVLFDPWRQESWDVSDTVLLGDPADDPDVGDFFRRLASTEALRTWHEQRIDGALGSRERAAAQKASVHANTPAVAHFDTLGQPFLTIAHNRFERDGAIVEEHYPTRIELDIEGNQRAVRDALAQAGDPLGRIVMRYDYDMLGNPVHSASMEAGERWTLNDVAGQPLRAWNSRGHAFRTEYDALRRPVRQFVRGHDVQDPMAELLFGRTEYGEGEPGAVQNNLRTRVVRVFDAAGVVTSVAYDYKGNLLRGHRQLAAEYRTHPDWAGELALEDEQFESATTYDALNRPVTVTTPDGSITRPWYNEAGLLERMAVNLRGAAEATVFVANIDYNAKGQRTQIDHGNGVRTTYDYDERTFRLARLHTRRGVDILQDLSYTYDPAGNITDLRDDAQQTIWFNNAVVEPHADYTYDAVYRLIAATGREHIGQLAAPQTSWNDEGRVRLPHPHDGQAMQQYTEQYDYDSVGNFLRLIHQAANGGSWTRDYAYEEASLIEPQKQSNRLSRTNVGATNEPYTHDIHGNMTTMPHLRLIQWDFQDHLRASARQVVNDGTPETTWYVYDAAGQRVRKVNERAADPGNTPPRRNERIYLGGFEAYREYETDGATVALERQTLHVMDGKQRVALVETRTQGNDDAPAQLARYQLGNHLGSACLELDVDAAIVSYEEFHPYGSTAYQAGRSVAEVSLKRYRYTGKERDEETGLNHHGARYYAPWLGRWTAADPLELGDGINPYAYVKKNPARLFDQSGTSADDPVSALLERQRDLLQLLHESPDAAESIQELNDVNEALGEELQRLGKEQASNEEGAGGSDASYNEDVNVRDAEVPAQGHIPIDQQPGYLAAKHALGIIDVVAHVITLGGIKYGEDVPEIQEARASGGAALAQIGSLFVGMPKGGGPKPAGPAPSGRGPKALPPEGGTTGSAPTQLDTNVLIAAFEGDAGALAEVRASTKELTAGVDQEFRSGTPSDRAARAAFLRAEGVVRFSKAALAAIRANPLMKKVSDAVKAQVDVTKRARKDPTVDADLAGTAKAMGRQLVTAERALTNVLTINSKIRKLGVNVRRFFKSGKSG